MPTCRRVCLIWSFNNRADAGEKTESNLVIPGLVKIEGEKMLKGSNWFERPVDGVVDEGVWKADVRLLVETHARLRDASPSSLRRS